MEKVLRVRAMARCVSAVTLLLLLSLLLLLLSLMTEVEKH